MATVAVFGSSQTRPGTPGWFDGEHVGRSLARAGHTVATGGYGGTMEAVSRGASQEGGHVVGVTADALFPHRGGANRYVDEVRDHLTIASRIRDLVDTSAGVIALPGSIGTATELLVAWNRLFIDSLRAMPKWPLTAVGQPWDVVIPRLVIDLDTTDGLVTLAESAAEACDRTIEILG